MHAYYILLILLKTNSVRLGVNIATEKVNSIISRRFGGVAVTYGQVCEGQEGAVQEGDQVCDVAARLTLGLRSHPVIRRCVHAQ